MSGAEIVDPTAESQRIMQLADARTLEIVQRRLGQSAVRRRGWLVRRTLLLADVLGLVIAFVVAQALFAPSNGSARFDQIDPLLELGLFLVTLPGWIVVAKLYRLYDRDEERTDHSTFDDLGGVFHLVTVGSWFFLATSWLTDLAHPTFPKLITFWALAIAVVTVGRAAGRSLCRRSVTYLQNTVIVGAGDVGQLVARKLLQHPEYGINLVGLIDSAPKERRGDLKHLTVLGPLEDLPAIVRTFDIERVIVAFSSESHEQILETIRPLQELWIQVDLVPRLFDLIGPGIDVHTVEGLPLLSLPPVRLSRSSRLLKACMDALLAAIGLAVLAPAFAAIALLIKLDSKGPIFFRQMRMGEGGKAFEILKFRTMGPDADDRKSLVAHLNKHLRPGGDPRMFKIVDDPRVTRIGRFLRRYSLDELPQLINVVMGEMSLVGPRPLILDEAQHVHDWARRRIDLKPGITGLWQVLGRGVIPFDEMVKLDYLYVTTWSLWNDCRLLLRTIPLVFNGNSGTH